LLAEKRFLRGTLTHALLEHLPEIAPAQRQAAAESFLAHYAPELGAKAASQLLTETLRVLSHPELAPLFGPNSLAEVPIAAELSHPDGRSAPLKLSGTIDRLVHTGREVLIVDYKSNRPPPRTPHEVAETYLLQLAAYRLAVAAIFPQTQVRAALLWTEGARIMEIPAALLDRGQDQLWRLAPASLDA
jgi:ATP-dependent helicase/nuclease subunit A